jgi:hypothetical protein
MSEQEQSQAVEETTQSLLNLSLVNPADEDVLGIVSVSTSPTNTETSESLSSSSDGGLAQQLQEQIENLKGTIVCFILLQIVVQCIHCFFLCVYR